MRCLLSCHRVRNKTLGFAVRTDNKGYYVDGLCDALAYFAYFWGEALFSIST